MDYKEKNNGFHPDIYEYLKVNFPNIRLMGFDSISVSSIQHRDVGRAAHRAFLSPEHPILFLEDMDLTHIQPYTIIESLIVAPFRINNSDGIPCFIIATISQNETN